jgi:hypothetical protein
LNGRHSSKLACLNSFFLYLLKCDVSGALVGVGYIPRLHLNRGPDCHELKRRPSIRLACLKYFFLNRLKSWVIDAFLIGDHFPRLHLNQSRVLILSLFIDAPISNYKQMFSEVKLVRDLLFPAMSDFKKPHIVDKFMSQWSLWHIPESVRSKVRLRGTLR